MGYCDRHRSLGFARYVTAMTVVCDEANEPLISFVALFLLDPAYTLSFHLHCDLAVKEWPRFFRGFCLKPFGGAFSLRDWHQMRHILGSHPIPQE